MNELGHPVTRIGEAPGGLAEALMLTSLPAKLRARIPSGRVRVRASGWNPVVFRGNPHVTGRALGATPLPLRPDRIAGSPPESGTPGHPIQSWERIFGVEISPDPKPEIHLTSGERRWVDGWLERNLLPQNRGKPLCVIHPWPAGLSGSAPRPPRDVYWWDAVVARWSPVFRFWQVGNLFDSAVQGCEYYELVPPGRRPWRRIFALMSRAQAFLGTAAAPMHVARAFDVPSLILVGPAYDSDPAAHPALYPVNRHLATEALDEERLRSETNAFLEARSKRSPVFAKE